MCCCFCTAAAMRARLPSRTNKEFRNPAIPIGTAQIRCRYALFRTGGGRYGAYSILRYRAVLAGWIMIDFHLLSGILAQRSVESGWRPTQLVRRSHADACCAFSSLKDDKERLCGCCGNQFLLTMCRRSCPGAPAITEE